MLQNHPGRARLWFAIGAQLLMLALMPAGNGCGGGGGGKALVSVTPAASVTPTSGACTQRSDCDDKNPITDDYCIYADYPTLGSYCSSIEYWLELGAGAASGTGVSSSGNSNVFPRMTFDAAGYPIVAWMHQGYIYTKKWNGSAWVELGAGSATGGGNVNPDMPTWGGAPGLATNALGEMYIAWADHENSEGKSIYIKRWDGNAWNFLAPGQESVGTHAYDLGPIINIVFDNQNLPIISWEEQTDRVNVEIFVMRWTGTAWEEMGAGSASSGGISNNPGKSITPHMVVNQDGHPIVTWCNAPSVFPSYREEGYQVFVKQWNGAEWEEIGPESASGPGITNATKNAIYPRIALDAQGYPIIIWEGDGYTNGDNLYAKRWNGSEWVEMGVDTATKKGIDDSSTNFIHYSNILTDAQGSIYVEWMQTDGVFVKKWDGSAWVEMSKGSASGLAASNRDPTGYLAGHTMALDASGVPYIAWAAPAPNYGMEIYVKKYGFSDLSGLF